MFSELNHPFSLHLRASIFNRVFMNEHFSGPSIWKQTVGKLGSNFRNLEEKMQSAFRRDPDNRELSSESTSMDYEKKATLIFDLYFHQSYSHANSDIIYEFDLRVKKSNIVKLLTSLLIF